MEVSADIGLTQETTLSGPLFYVNLNVVKDDQFAVYLEHRHRNTLRFRATPSADPYAWHGMNLELLEASEWSYPRAARVCEWYYGGWEDP